MAYRRKHLFGLLPFWPTYPVGFFAGVLLAECCAPGRRYMCAGVGVLRQLPRAICVVLADEVRNVWRARRNNRVV